jgi:hypothetical protein
MFQYSAEQLCDVSCHSKRTKKTGNIKMQEQTIQKLSKYHDTAGNLVNFLNHYYTFTG